MAKQKKIGEVEIFYIEGNCHNKTQEELAKIIGVNVEDISEIYLKSKKKSNDKFQRYSGTTSMTQAQSSVTPSKTRTNIQNNIHKL